jgi:O-antigen ligase
MTAVKHAVDAALAWPAGTGYWGWFDRTGSLIWPHNDFFFSLGIYGIPGAALFTAFVVLLMRTVKRTPLTLEKLYARAVLTFLLVMGLNIKQLSAKYYWVFLAFVLAAERIAHRQVETQEQLPAEIEDDESQSPQLVGEETW